MSLTWVSAARSHLGMVRKHNEDAFLERPERGLWAVADGMGGHAAGDVASRLVVEALDGQVYPAAAAERVAAAAAALALANRRLCEEAALHYQGRTIGSTAVVLLAGDGEGGCVWAGDSRLYRLRGGRLEQLSHDHSYVQELIDQGELDAEAARYHPLAHAITRAVGAAAALVADTLTFPLAAGDVFLLCSDGLTRTVADTELAELLEHPDVTEIVQTLIHLALVRGAPDNVTAIVVAVREAESGEETQRLAAV